MQARKFSAYTLMEILVVLTIIGILMSIGMITYSRVINSAQKQAAMNEMKGFAPAIHSYKMENNRAPADVQELLDGGYINKSLSIDPWQQPYRLEVNDAAGTIKIFSAGPDKTFGTKDDITVEDQF
jgi:general secretion pathway protein G